jgi:hypothetical protein
MSQHTPPKDLPPAEVAHGRSENKQEPLPLLEGRVQLIIDGVEILQVAEDGRDLLPREEILLSDGRQKHLAQSREERSGHRKTSQNYREEHRQQLHLHTFASHTPSKISKEET